MKNTPFLRYSLIGLTGLTLLFACKKDNDAPKPPAERILGVWNIVKETEKYYTYNTGVLKDSFVITLPPGTWTMEFRTDGKVYETQVRSGQTDRDTLPYSLQADTLLIIDGYELSINKFEAAHLITTDWYDDGSNDVEHILEWKK